MTVNLEIRTALVNLIGLVCSCRKDHSPQRNQDSQAQRKKGKNKTPFKPE